MQWSVCGEGECVEWESVWSVCVCGVCVCVECVCVECVCVCVCVVCVGGGDRYGCIDGTFSKKASKHKIVEFRTPELETKGT